MESNIDLWNELIRIRDAHAKGAERIYSSEASDVIDKSDDPVYLEASRLLNQLNTAGGKELLRPEIETFINKHKTAMKKTAIEPIDMTKGGNPPAEEENPDLGGLDLGGDGGVDLGGGLGGGANPLGGGGLGGGNPLEDMAEGMSNEYYDSLKVTKKPDLEKAEAEDDSDEIDWSQLT